MTKQISPEFQQVGAPSLEQLRQQRVSQLPPNVQIEYAVLQDKQRLELQRLRDNQQNERPERLREEMIRVMQQMLPPAPAPRGMPVSTKSVRDRAEERATATITRDEQMQLKTLARHQERRVEEFIHKAERRLEHQRTTTKEFNRAARTPFTRH